MTISQDRIERAARPIAERNCGEIQFAGECNQPDVLCTCRISARAALEADAPEIAAAEVRAYEDGMRHARAPILASSFRIAEARGRVKELTEVREIISRCPLKPDGGVIINDIKEERDAEIIAALDARRAAITTRPE